MTDPTRARGSVLLRPLLLLGGIGLGLLALVILLGAIENWRDIGPGQPVSVN